MASVQLEHLRKTYDKGKVIAVNDVSFTVEQGELFGLIGPDGSGKTSIFRMLTTLLLPDGGRAVVEGMDVVKDFRTIRRTVGYMPGKFSLYQDLTVEENLDFFATVFGTTIRENYDLIRDIYIQIEPFKNRRAGKLSGGMKQKLALCCALIHKPSVLFLDEPTTGVDAVSRKEFWELLKRLKSQHITILVSTPYMDEATLCDRIALIQNGNILSVNTPAHITQSFRRSLWAVKSDDMFQLLQDLRAYPHTRSCYTFGEYDHLTLHDTSNTDRQVQQDIRRYLENKLHTNIQIKNIEATIEDSFMELMTQHDQHANNR